MRLAKFSAVLYFLLIVLFIPFFAPSFSFHRARKVQIVVMKTSSLMRCDNCRGEMWPLFGRFIFFGSCLLEISLSESVGAVVHG